METSRECAWARYVIWRLAPGAWGRERPAGGWDPGGRACFVGAFVIFTRLLLLRELEICGTRGKLRSGSENRRAAKSSWFSNPTEHLNHLGSY